MDKIFGRVMAHSRTKSVREVYDYAEERDLFAARWRKEVWGKNQLDGIIAPIQASPAVPHG